MMFPESFRMLKKFGLELLAEYDFLPNEYEEQIFDSKKDQIQTVDTPHG